MKKIFTLILIIFFSSFVAEPSFKICLLKYSGGGDWYADTGFSKNSFGHYIVSWNIYNNAAVSLYQSDAVPSVVPIPPSAIMLFSGILGLFGVRRMRRDG